VHGRHFGVPAAGGGCRGRSYGFLRNAVAQAERISDNRGYNHIAGFHGAPDWYCWHHQFSPRTPLQARIFLPWHRAYLWWLEQSLQEIVQEPVALPWWDWTAEAGLPDAYAALQLNGEPNPLYQSRAFVPTANPPIDADTQRDPGANPQAVLPSADEIIDLLNDSDWASFSDRLEQFHDDVHVWEGRDMQDITTAATTRSFSPTTAWSIASGTCGRRNMAKRISQAT
jgi:tyrosinase